MQRSPPYLDMGIVGRAPAEDEKVMFLSVCLFFWSRFGMTKFVIMETLWSSVTFKTIMVSLHRGRFVLVHLYSTFSVDPSNFFLGKNLYQKLRFFAIFWGRSPLFFYPKRWNLACRCGPRISSPIHFFVKKNRVRGIPLFQNANNVVVVRSKAINHLHLAGRWSWWVPSGCQVYSHLSCEHVWHMTSALTLS